jgi:oligogalacturonide lyase
MFMVRTVRNLLAAVVVLIGAASLPYAAELPVTWVDKDTGHRILRLTPEPGSSGFYFNVNAYSPDGKLMAYTAPDGIHVLELATKQTRLLVPNPPHARHAAKTPGFPGNPVHSIVVGRKTNSVFFTQYDPAANTTTISKANMYTGAMEKLTTLSGRVSVPTINADETLAAGTMNDGPAVAPEYGANLVSPNGTPVRAQVQSESHVQPEGKAEMMERR